MENNRNISIYNPNNNIQNNFKMGSRNNQSPTTIKLHPCENNGYFEVSYIDIEKQLINGVSLCLYFPEISGTGSIGFNKDARFNLINSISAYYVEYIEELGSKNEILINTMSGESLLRALKSIQNSENLYFKNNNDGTELKQGSFSDDLIFKEKFVNIPLHTLLTHDNNFICLPQTKIIFRWKFNDFTNCVYYNELFGKKTLEKILLKTKNSSYNSYLSLVYSNLQGNINGQEETQKRYLIRKTETKTGVNQNKNILQSGEFQNAYGVSFHSKFDIFNSNNKFIVVPGSKTDIESIKKKWILKVLSDLIIVTNRDLSLNEEKRELGFSNEAKFVKVENNTVYHDEYKRKSCKIFIQGIPEDHNVYYHTNILTFARKNNKNDVLNVSKLFSYIKGIFFEDDTISFMYENLETSIGIDIVSIPVNFWDHEFNTETKDLRSILNKTSDVYYNNNLILGADFNSYDQGYSTVRIELDTNNFKENLVNNTKINTKFQYFQSIETDENMYSNISLLDLCYNDRDTVKFITSDGNINFTKITAHILWNNYKENDPKSLYGPIGFLDVYEFTSIVYENNKIRLVISRGF